MRPDHPGWVYGAFNSREGNSLAGLYLSTNQGDTWGRVSGTAGLDVTALAFDPGHSGTMALGTNGGTVYTTTDDGLTWSDPVNVAVHIARLAYAPTLYQGLRGLWASTHDSDFDGDAHARVSTDGGETWADVPGFGGLSNVRIRLS